MRQISSMELTDHILCADAKELFQILDAAAERFSELFPDRELLRLSVPGSDPESQIAELQKAILLLSSMKK